MLYFKLSYLCINNHLPEVSLALSHLDNASLSIRMELKASFWCNCSFSVLPGYPMLTSVVGPTSLNCICGPACVLSCFSRVRSYSCPYQAFLPPTSNASRGCSCVLLSSRSVVSDSLWLHELQHARLPRSSPSPWVYSNPHPPSPSCHPTISSSVTPFSSCPQSFLASGNFPKSWLFTSGGQSTGASASASILPVNIQDCHSLVYPSTCFSSPRFGTWKIINVCLINEWISSSF